MIGIVGPAKMANLKDLKNYVQYKIKYNPFIKINNYDPKIT